MDVLSSKIDDLHLKISEQAAVEKISGRKIFFLGESKESVLTQLVLMKDQVHEAVLYGLSQDTDGVAAGVNIGLEGIENSQEVSLFFKSAAANFCKASISARFIKEVTGGCEPRSCTQLNAFTVVQDNKRRNRLMLFGTVREVDGAFRNVEISPYHVFDDDASGDGRVFACIGLAARFRRTDLLRYFDSQSIGIMNLDDGFSALSGFWQGIVDIPLMFADSSSVAMLDYSAEVFAEFDICDDSENSVPTGCLRAHNSNLDRMVRMMGDIIRVLEAKNFELEEQGCSQSTSLLSLSVTRGKYSTEICRLLCENGVNVYTTDKCGRNALDRAMYSQCGQRGEEGFLEERLAF
ncbi:hypothetical protein LTR84_004671 [Exophiala bonariae]|uniref:Uncharacterized protein n=1 Tax=Exophiala bonariae TaxID=1690606 RepID=A0AAV9NMJ5_9EURO|nr:hypothetical protein LTR84_004671 [Exophiala bonariae]